ncbi:MAG: glycosyltransferase [Hyphomonas sp.]|nr:glycosyltransferase [Hyphomonas sp.]
MIYSGNLPTFDTGRGDIRVIANAHEGPARLSICIPTFRDDPSELIRRLTALPGARDCELLIYDDGSDDPDMSLRIAAAIMNYPGPAQFIAAARNSGRSTARNMLVSAASRDWVLFIDADMLPDDAGYLSRYLDFIEAQASPAVIAGGFSLKQAQPGRLQRLHAAQARQSDCLPATRRASDPGRYVFTSNILVHRQVLSGIPFDEQYKGWGWEDVDWGLRVASVFPIHHIDNTATHLGLDSDKILVRKFAGSGANYARLVHRHPVAAARMSLTRVARRVRHWPFLAGISRAVALQTLLPVPVRLFALKLHRARMYADHI